MDQKKLEGTTTIGLTCKDGLVFICDKRASSGRFVASKRAHKVFKINNKVGATVAGSVGDAEALMRLIRAEVALYKYNNKEVMSPKAISNLMANILQGNRIFPYLVQLLVGGMDEDRSKLFTLDPVGGLIEEKYAATGSGSPIAYGVLERNYSEDNSMEENIPVAIEALDSAMERDSASGDGMNLATITEEGFKEYEEEEVKKLTKEVIGEKE